MKIVLTLIKHGAHLQITNTTGDTAADIASRKHHEDIVKLLRTNGAHPVKHFGQKNASVAKRLTLNNTKQLPNTGAKQQRPYEGWPPLMEAAWRDQEDIVRELIKRGTLVDSMDNQGHTALTRAACKGNGKIAKILLEAGADPYVDQENGINSLMCAAASGDPETVDTCGVMGEAPV